MSRTRRDVLLTAVALCAATGCTTTRYVTKTKGAPVHQVRFVNDCTQGTAHLYFDGEYRQKRRLDVRPRNIKPGEAGVFDFTAGTHRFVAEVFGFWSTSGAKVNGEFLVNRSGTVRVCGDASR